jgi:hypothetical protein
MKLMAGELPSTPPSGLRRAELPSRRGFGSLQLRYLNID